MTRADLTLLPWSKSPVADASIQPPISAQAMHRCISTLMVVFASRVAVTGAFSSARALALGRGGGSRRLMRSSTVRMALQTGIVGLPNVGKSTLFNALTESMGAEAANYPFCTIEPNVGTAVVSDPRIDVRPTIDTRRSLFSLFLSLSLLSFYLSLSLSLSHALARAHARAHLLLARRDGRHVVSRAGRGGGPRRAVARESTLPPGGARVVPDVRQKCGRWVVVWRRRSAFGPRRRLRARRRAGVTRGRCSRRSTRRRRRSRRRSSSSTSPGSSRARPRARGSATRFDETVVCALRSHDEPSKEYDCDCYEGGGHEAAWRVS